MDNQTFLTAIEMMGVGTGQNPVPPVVPPAITDLSVLSNVGSITLGWTNNVMNNGVYDSQTIDRAEGSGDFLALATIAGDATSYEDTTAVIGTTYSYRAKALRLTYPSNWSNVVTDTPTSAVARSADFPGSASNKILVNAANTSLDLTVDYAITLFVRPTFIGETTKTRGIFGKGLATTAATLEWALYYTESDNKLNFSVSDGVTKKTVKTAANPFVINTWYFVHIDYNSGTDVLSLDIDRGTPVTLSSVGSNQTVTDDVIVGGVNDVGYDSWLGQISCLGVFGDNIDSDQLDVVYNNGFGNVYANIGDAQSSCVAFWSLDELSTGAISVVRTDSAGANDVHLADAQKIPSTTLYPN